MPPFCSLTGPCIVRNIDKVKRKDLKKLNLILGIICILLFYPFKIKADIYGYVGKDGTYYFTNVPTSHKYKLMRKELFFENNPLIYDLAKKYRVDPCLVKAIIKAESSFDPYAVSHKGAEGLMQLMPETAKELKVGDSFIPRENLEGGIKHLRYLLTFFKGNLKFAVAAYNAGENAVLKYNGIPPYKETRNYVKKVLNYFNDYKKTSN